MDVCADAHMAGGCLVPLLAVGIRRRKDAVVYRSGFSNKASSRVLGFWDKSNNLTQVFASIPSGHCRSVGVDFEAPCKYQREDKTPVTGRML